MGCLVSFWHTGMVITPDVKYKFTVQRPLHISKAAVDCTSVPDDIYDTSTIGLLVDCGDKKGITLCNLYMHYDKRSSKPEADLDLYFMAGETISLYSGFKPGCYASLETIHLSGYQM